MRKSIFLTLVLSLCMVDFGAFAATTTRARSATTNPAAETSRRATARVARSATNNNKAVTARAATQKALSMGTKVATATTNTVVSDTCQEAYYGCMDTFCMLDNASGGRCQCSDRVVELNAVLDEILSIDEQSTRIATEGVEKVQMGEFADQISSQAKSIETEISSSTKATSTTASPRTLSLNTSSFDLTSFYDASLFDSGEQEVFQETPVNDIANKTGDSLQNAAAKLCVARIPKECKESSSLLQMAYVQKVKSDCIGYENALKQQKMTSQQKLLAAQKAVRDAVLVDVREKNKYATVGDCAVAFAKCMQTTAECKSDYTGCVTLAAAENVRNNKAGSKAKQTKIKGVVSGADITLAASTMESLLAKKEICASVTHQCVNANKNDAVWDVFLRNAAPALKSAELIAEQDLRSNCIPSVAECFKTACRSQFLDNEESYDMCLSNPATYKSLCKVQLEPCLEATGGTYDKPEKSTLWNGLVAMLNSMKVDACTKEVKDCLTERCGSDYSGCIGLDTYSIGKLCPSDKLTACMTATDPKDGLPYYKDENAIRQYVAEIAQGLALQIDNSLIDACQNAANDAMIKVCGDTETCDAVKLDLSALTTLMKVQACALQRDDKGNEKRLCLPDESQFTDDEIYGMGYGDQTTANARLIRESDENGMSSYGVYATLLNKPDVSNIVFDEVNGENSDAVMKFFAQSVTRSVDDTLAMMIVDNFSQQSTDAVVTILQGVLDRTMEQIEAEPKIIYCKTGREVQGFSADEKFGKKGIESARFPGLTDKYRYVVANSLLSKLYENNSELEDSFSEELSAMNKKITERVAKIAQQRGDAVEQIIDERNDEICKSKNKNHFVNTSNNCGSHVMSWSKIVVNVESHYDYDSNICTVKRVRYDCTDWHTPWFCHNYCQKFNDGMVLDTTEEHMEKFQ